MKPALRFLTRLVQLLLLVVGLSYVAPTQAQNYSFNVTDLNMQVFVLASGQVRIEYEITFVNNGQTIDIVDIGMPHAGYNINNMSASIEGVTLNTIRPSEYVNPGVEIPLPAGSAAIRRGETKTLRLTFTMPDLIYQDVTKQDYASLQITPTWFDDSFVNGSGKIRIAIHMLPGILAEEMLYQDSNKPFQQVQLDDHLMAFWEFSGPATRAYPVGISFPKRGVTRVVQQNLLDLTNKALRDNPFVAQLVGAVAVGALSFFFFRFTGGTGLVLWLMLTGGLVFIMWVQPFVSLVSLPIFGGLIIWNELSLHKKRTTYLPPIAQVEGGGIKRGLTAPEAAVILELPIQRVLGLVIFGLLKKGVLEQLQATPLRVRITPEFRGDQKARLQAALTKGIVLHTYEHAFLETINPEQALEQQDFGRAIKGLLDYTADRIKGFDLSDTQDYYRQIVKRATTEAQSVGDIAQREKQLDRDMEWILMDQRPTSVFQTGGWNYRPIWIRTAGGGGTSSGGGSSKSSGTQVGGSTGLGDVAAGFAGWAESTMGGLASAIAPGSVQATTSRGVIDLSGVDKVTGEVLKELGKSSSSGSGRSGGGGGRSCACACAGCACACACAGGGR